VRKEIEFMKAVVKLFSKLSAKLKRATGPKQLVVFIKILLIFLLMYQ
jgi:hypothetical protein